MTDMNSRTPGIRHGLTLSRRLALAAPLAALSGCGLGDSWFGEHKTPLAGKRVAVMESRRGLEVDKAAGRVTLPPPADVPNWPQPGGTAQHAGGHIAVAEKLTQAWRSDIGEGTGFRAAITAQPVIADGRVFTMDSDGVVSAYEVAGGRRIWRQETQGEDDRSTNVGGGISVGGDTLYAATGRADLVALDAATGHEKWRKDLGRPARSAPTIVDNTMFISLLGDQVVSVSQSNGERLWAYQATSVETSILGLYGPAVSEGLVVAGFGSGDLVTLRQASGTVAWNDSLAAARGRNSLVDLSAVRGMPVIADGRVYATSLGGLTLALDLRSGRRLWEHDAASGETPWLAGDWLFLLTADFRLAAISRNDGRVAWLTQLQTYADPEKQKDPIRWTGPVLAGDRLVVASNTGIAQAISPYTGEVLGEQKLPDGVEVAPVAAAGTVWLIANDATLVALR
jgi:outer membrane protein assembly factor BamB